MGKIAALVERTPELASSASIGDCHDHDPGTLGKCNISLKNIVGTCWNH